jgi:hypothetical protein
MAAPERFAEKSDLLLQRGHRPYMALADIPRRRYDIRFLGQSGVRRETGRE